MSSHDADWSLDFCLACDRQTSDGPYCSNACRQADLRKSGIFSSATSQPSTSAPSSTSSSYSHSSGFYLPPAIDFNAVKRSPTTSASTFSTYSVDRTGRSKRESIDSADTTMSDSYFLQRSHTYPSGSQTNLLSESTRKALKEYEGLFDTSRRKQAYSLHR